MNKSLEINSPSPAPRSVLAGAQKQLPITLLALLLALPITLLAQLHHQVTDGNVTITGYTPPGGDEAEAYEVVVPAMLEGFPVTRIGEEVFAYCWGMTNISLPLGLLDIGPSAFVGCSALTVLTIPAGVTNIGQSAFEDCPWLLQVNLPDSLVSIGQRAFYACEQLTELTLPVNLSLLGPGAFLGCTALTNITVAALNTNFSSFDGVLYTQSGTEAALGPVGKTGECVVAPGARSIASAAFGYCLGLTNVVLPGGLTNLGCFAFA